MYNPLYNPTNLGFWSLWIQHFFTNFYPQIHNRWKGCRPSRLARWGWPPPRLVGLLVSHYPGLHRHPSALQAPCTQMAPPRGRLGGLKPNSTEKDSQKAGELKLLKRLSLGHCLSLIGRSTAKYVMSCPCLAKVFRNARIQESNGCGRKYHSLAVGIVWLFSWLRDSMHVVNIVAKCQVICLLRLTGNQAVHSPFLCFTAGTAAY